MVVEWVSEKSGSWLMGPGRAGVGFYELGGSILSVAVLMMVRVSPGRGMYDFDG